MRYLVKVSYSGTKYQGWQKQDTVPSIQETLEKVLSKLYNSTINIFASGRTDAGVHALGQHFHFDAENRYEPDDLLYRMNCLLPEDIEVIDIKIVNDDFHARFSAKSKTYKYLIKNKEKDAIKYEYVYLYKEKIDEDILRNACSLFVGKHNFQDFTSKEEDEDNFIRVIYSIDVIKNNDEYEVYLKGNGFMRYEIRFIIGTVLAASTKKITLESIKDHLKDNKEREIVNNKAPANGLYLVDVEY